MRRVVEEEIEKQSNEVRQPCEVVTRRDGIESTLWGVTAFTLHCALPLLLFFFSTLYFFILFCFLLLNGISRSNREEAYIHIEINLCDISLQHDEHVSRQVLSLTVLTGTTLRDCNIFSSSWFDWHRLFSREVTDRIDQVTVTGRILPFSRT